MTEPPPFREEALTHHRAQRGPGTVLRVAPGWTRWAFWALVIIAVAALIAGAVVGVDEDTFVPAAARGAEVRAPLPPGAEDQVRVGQPASFIPLGDGVEPVDVRIVAVEGGVVRARAAAALGATAGRLRLTVGSRSLLRDLVPGL